MGVSSGPLSATGEVDDGLADYDYISPLIFREYHSAGKGLSRKSKREAQERTAGVLRNPTYDEGALAHNGLLASDAECVAHKDLRSAKD